MVFILPALWWTRIRGLWKLCDGRDWLWGKLGLVLMDRAMLCKSLMQFSVDRWTVFPPCCLTWNETMVELMKIMSTSFKRSPACTPTLSAPDPAAGHHWPMLPPETPGHSLTGKSGSVSCRVTGSFLLGPDAHKVLFVPSKCHVSPVLCKFWWLYGGVNGNLLQEGLCHTQVCCIQSPCPCGRSLLTCTSTGDTQTLKGRSDSVSVGSPGAFKALFELSECLWWVWSLILNAISSPLPSC